MTLFKEECNDHDNTSTLTPILANLPLGSLPPLDLTSSESSSILFSPLTAEKKVRTNVEIVPRLSKSNVDATKMHSRLHISPYPKTHLVKLAKKDAVRKWWKIIIGRKAREEKKIDKH